MWCSLRVSILGAVILLSMSPMGDAEHMNPDVIGQSKIKKSSFKQIFNDIKKTLPKKMRRCPMVVTKIKLLKEENDGVAEDWTIDVCRETKVYLVSTFQPKGYYCDVILKEEALTQEIKYWEAAKRHGDEDFWRESLLYVDEIEAMSQDGNNTKVEKKAQ